MTATKSAFNAIADPTRRSILDRLMLVGPTRAGDLAKQFPQMSRPAVSKHLSVLRRAQLVQQMSEGREIWYELNPEPLFQVQDWLEHYQGYWEERLHGLKETVENEAG
jgi:DNA-binding transcriptional ArsR family regulator